MLVERQSTVHRRMRRRKRWIVLACVAFAGLLGVADHRGWLLVRRNDDLAIYHGAHVMVDRVIDGDTLDVHLPDPQTGHPTTRVCLWGVNCPEASRFGKPAAPLADEATQLAQSLAAHQTVMLRLESQRLRDTFGRILAHVDLPDGRILNEELLMAGLARIDDRWPHTMLVRYAQLEYTAKRKGVGMWAKKTK